MRKTAIFATLLVLAAASLAPVVYGKTIPVSIFKGVNDKIRVELPSVDEIFSQDLKAGDQLIATVTEDVVHTTPSNLKYYIVKKNANVYLNLIEFNKPGAFGRPGKIKAEFESVEAAGPGVNGEGYIPLDNSIIIAGEGKGKKLISIILFPVGWLMKGGKPKIDDKYEVPFRFEEGQEFISVEVSDK